MWSLMIKMERVLAGPGTILTFGSAQYAWHPTKDGGFPDPEAGRVRLDERRREHSLRIAESFDDGDSGNDCGEPWRTCGTVTTGL
jgi:hypothetical protein